MARDRRRQRGVALAVVALGLTAMLAVCVVAVELAHLGLSVNELQVAADSAATAAARGLLKTREGGFEIPELSGVLVAARNTVDGMPAFLAPVLVSVTRGTFDMPTRTFTPGGARPNAARAVATATVSTIFATVLGQSTSQLHREAVAEFGGTCSARTALPIALGDCLFDRFAASGNCATLPSLVDTPDPTQNSCWTSLQANTANANQALAFLPAECCQGRNCGGGQPAPRLDRGSQVNGINGQVTVLLRVIRDCFRQGITDFAVPIIACGRCNQQTTVTGFATVHVRNVQANGVNKGIDVDTVCSGDDPSGPIGCASFGRESVALVK